MNFNPDDLIINRPDLVQPGQKLTAWGITLFFWGALLYLWQPLISLVAWGLNIDLFYNHMILLGGYRTFIKLLANYLQVIAILGGGLILWGRINQLRFRGKERRRALGDTDIVQLQEYFGVTNDEFNNALDARVVEIKFTQNCKIALMHPSRTASKPVLSIEIQQIVSDGLDNSER